jgi:hypothetical protein
MRYIKQIIIVGPGGSGGFQFNLNGKSGGGGGGGEVKVFSGSMLVAGTMSCSIPAAGAIFPSLPGNTTLTIGATTYTAVAGTVGGNTVASGNGAGGGGDGGYGGAGGVVSLVGDRGLGSAQGTADDATSGTPVVSGSWTSYPGGGGSAGTNGSDSGSGFSAGAVGGGGGGGGYDATFGRGGNGTDALSHPSNNTAGRIIITFSPVP